jgi:hypothetical protein
MHVADLGDERRVRGLPTEGRNQAVELRQQLDRPVVAVVVAEADRGRQQPAVNGDGVVGSLAGERAPEVARAAAGVRLLPRAADVALPQQDRDEHGAIARPDPMRRPLEHGHRRLAFPRPGG